MSSSKPLGEILVEKGYITQQQLDAALSVDNQGKIGELLVSWKFVTQQQIGEALSIQAAPPPPPPPPPPPQVVYNPPPPPITPPSAPDLTMDTLQTSKFKIDMKTLIWVGSLLFTGVSTYFGFTMELNSRFDALEDVDNSAMVELERKFTELKNTYTPIGEGVYSADPNSTWPPSRTEYNMKDMMARNLLIEIQKDIEDLKKDIEKLEEK